LTERRKGRRFIVDWPVQVEGKNGGGNSFERVGVLQNISSGGAMLFLTNPVPTGMKLDVYIRLPFKGKKWMKYTAQIIRIEDGSPDFVAAVKFEGARPEFVTQ
jgi:PilZ domain